MSKLTLEYTEKHHTLEVDGVEYEIPQRTAILEAKLKEHDKKALEMTEYEGNMDLLAVLFGEENANKMFPDKNTTNLNKLAKCARVALAAYFADYILIKEMPLKDQLENAGLE